MFAVQYIETNTNSLQRMTGDAGKLVFSRLRDWHNKSVFCDISIKYVLRGTETYFDADGIPYKVETGQLLLGYFEPNTGECVVRSPTCVDGVCIYIKPEVLTDVYTTLCDEAKADDRYFPGSSLAFPDFFNNIFDARHTPLRKQLEQCSNWFYNRESVIDENTLQEFLLETAEKIVLLQSGVQQALRRFASQRPKTGREILKRLLYAKAFMDDNYLCNPSLADMAAQGGFSKYHFLRCFRQAYRQTPFDYIQDKRLQFASIALQKKEACLKEIAAQCSFSDLAAFSKAFKKKFGVPPSVVQGKGRRV